MVFPSWQILCPQDFSPSIFFFSTPLYPPPCDISHLSSFNKFIYPLASSRTLIESACLIFVHGNPSIWSKLRGFSLNIYIYVIAMSWRNMREMAITFLSSSYTILQLISFSLYSVSFPFYMVCFTCLSAQNFPSRHFSLFFHATHFTRCIVFVPHIMKNPQDLFPLIVKFLAPSGSTPFQQSSIRIRSSFLHPSKN